MSKPNVANVLAAQGNKEAGVNRGVKGRSRHAMAPGLRRAKQRLHENGDAAGERMAPGLIL